MGVFLFEPLEDDVPPEGIDGADFVAPGLMNPRVVMRKFRQCHHEMSVALVYIPCSFHLGLD